MTSLIALIVPITLLAAIPVHNISDHCFCDLSGHMPHCRIKEQHPMTVQFARKSDGSENDNCIFSKHPISAGHSGLTDYVSCDKRSAIIEWKDVNNNSNVYYISDDKDETPTKLDIITVQTVNQRNERMLVPLTLDANLVVERPNSCHLVLPSSVIKARL